MEEMEDADSRSHLPTDGECPWNKRGMTCACASAHEVDESGYEIITKEINRPSVAIMMGTPKFSVNAMKRRSGATGGNLKLSAISLMMCTEVTEACNVKEAIDWNTACDLPMLN